MHILEWKCMNLLTNSLNFVPQVQMNVWWPSLLTHICVTLSQWVNFFTNWTQVIDHCRRELMCNDLDKVISNGNIYWKNCICVDVNGVHLLYRAMCNYLIAIWEKKILHCTNVLFHHLTADTFLDARELDVVVCRVKSFSYITRHLTKHSIVVEIEQTLQLWKTPSV